MRLTYSAANLLPPPLSLESSPSHSLHTRGRWVSDEETRGACTTSTNVPEHLAGHYGSTGIAHDSARMKRAGIPVRLVIASPIPDLSNTVHICQWVTGGLPCNATVGESVRAARDHLNQVHQFRGAANGPVVCLWAGCRQTLQRGNMLRHILSSHFRVRINCVECGLSFSRRDVHSSHARVCRARRRNASRPDSQHLNCNAR